MVVNDPEGLLRAGSKMYLSVFPPEIRPRTLTTRSPERVRSFLRALDGPAVIKPLNGYGGQKRHLRRARRDRQSGRHHRCGSKAADT